MVKTADLIRKFQKGEKNVFSKIVSRHQGYVYRLALKRLGMPEDAEDLCQDVFLKLFHCLDRFQFRSDIKTYLYRMVANESFSHFRKAKKQRKNLMDLEKNSRALGAAERAPEEDLIQRELLWELKKAIGLLPQKYRTLIFLKDFEKRPYREIARKLRLSENTAKLRHHYALKRLRKICREREGPEKNG